MATAAATRPSEPRRRGTARRRRRDRPRVNRTFYLFLLPTLVLFTLCITLPAIMGITFSFTDSVGFGEFEFIGLTNYVALFSDPAIRSSYLFTIGFALVTVLLVNVVAFLLAVGLTAKIRGKVALRAVFVLPMVISGIVIAYVFNFLFSNSLPQLGQAVGITRPRAEPAGQPRPGLGDDRHRHGVAGDPQRAAHLHRGDPVDPRRGLRGRVDGRRVRALRRLVSITLPLVAGYVVINLVIGFKNFLNAYDIIVGLTNGGPGTATRSVAMTIFSGFTGGDYAYQMANATIFFLIAVVLAVIQLRLNRGRSAF